MRTFHSALLLACLTSFSIGCTSQAPMRTVAHVDIPKYMGDWYVIGEIPNFAEKHCFDSIESYALLADNSIDNRFRCRKRTFDAPMKQLTHAKATIKDPNSNASWQLRFYKIVPAKYLILDLDPDYQWVMVGHPSRSVGWIMARSQTVPEPIYEAILERTRDQGYEPAKFIKVPQRDSSPP
jgi:apolipoprotein D and lipocalin family protein